FEGGLGCYPAGGCMDGRSGDHVLLAPPYIATAADIDMIVDRLGQAVDLALKSVGHYQEEQYEEDHHRYRLARRIVPDGAGGRHAGYGQAARHAGVRRQRRLWRLLAARLARPIQRARRRAIARLLG